MDSVVENIKAVETSILGCHRAIDKIKQQFDDLRSARSEYLKVKEQRHIIIFSFIHKNRLAKVQSKYDQTFNMIFGDYLYFTSKIKLYLSKLLSEDIYESVEFAEFYNKLDSLITRCDEFSKNINSEYLLSEGVEDFDYELLYSRNLVYEISGFVERLKQKYSNFGSRIKRAKVNKVSLSEEKATSYFGNE